MAAPTRYRYEFGAQIEDTRVKRTIPEYAVLEVWSPPEAAQGYVVSAIPAYSTNEECADHVAQVWRATRDTLE